MKKIVLYIYTDITYASAEQIFNSISTMTSGNLGIVQGLQNILSLSLPQILSYQEEATCINR